MKFIKYTLFFVILLALALGLLLYRLSVSVPSKVVIAAGPAGGNYYHLSKEIAKRLEEQLGTQVEVLESRGALDNLHRIQDGIVDFALYQPDTARGTNEDENPDSAAFVANLYSEVLHIFAAPDSGIERAADLRGKKIAIGSQESGDFSLNKTLLEHLGIGLDDIELVDVVYQEIPELLRSGRLDAACMAGGLHSPAFAETASVPGVRLIPVPFADAMSLHHVSTFPTSIPAGFYRTEDPVLPEAEIKTVSRRAKLLTRPDAPTVLVEAVTNVVMDEHFQRTNELHELFDRGKAFAMANPEFPMHGAAEHIYNPALKPLLNPDFVEATEGLRSFFFSLLVAGWLMARWLRDRRLKQDEHELDRFVRLVLDIERRQLGLDEDESGKDVEQLQRLLDEVTQLRQEALGEFNAHSMNEDPSVACFVQMCHALSNKINAKLTRQRTDRQLRLFMELTKQQPISTSDLPKKT
ncbi:MAG: TAXI family TRAP transporter solute-binding subunit [Rubripirellula sp.]|nr:TAXI family TRAP transporter solute-binding subunit [Rubripirellula sp.]